MTTKTNFKKIILVAGFGLALIIGHFSLAQSFPGAGEIPNFDYLNTINNELGVTDVVTGDTTDNGSAPSLNIPLETTPATTVKAPTVNQTPDAPRRTNDSDAYQIDLESLTTDQAQDKDEADCKVTAATGAAAAGVAAAAAGGGVGIPVVDFGLIAIAGQISASSALTAGNTTQMVAQLHKICMYLKAVKRIQTKFETTQYLEDPVARRLAATNAAEYVKAQLEYAKTGHQSPASIANAADSATNGTNPATDQTSVGDSSFAPANRQLVKAQTGVEAVNVYLDDYNKSGDIYKNDTARILARQQVAPRNYSTITTAQRDSFLNNDPSMTNDSYMDTFVEMANPDHPNNPMTSWMLATGELEQRKEMAIADLNQRLIEGRGFLSNDKCVSTTADGRTCRQWITVTPGSVIADSVNMALGSKLRQTELADQFGEVIPGDEPQVNEVAQMTATALGGGGAGPKGKWETFLDFLKQLLPSYDFSSWLPSDSGEDDGNDDGGDDNATLPLPKIDTLAFSMPTLAELTAGTATNTASLIWSASNASDCKAGNDWLSASVSNPNTISAIYTTGATIPTSGSATINLPLPISATVTMTEGGVDHDYSDDLAISTDSSKLAKILTYAPTGTIMPTDTYSLALANEPIITVGENGITPATASNLVTLFENKINSLLSVAGSNFKRYGFSYGASDLTVSVKPTYSLKCFNADGKSVTANVTLIRQ